MINFNITFKYDAQEKGYSIEKMENDHKYMSKLIYNTKRAAQRDLDNGHVEWIIWEDA